MGNDKMIIIKCLRQKHLVFSALAIAIIIVSVFNFCLLSPNKDSAYPNRVFGIPVHTQIVEKGMPGRAQIKRRIRYVVIHETANHNQGADAKSHANYLSNGGEGSTSWHYTVDDHEIYHHIPDNEVAWQAGDRRKHLGGNMCGIGIELCVNSDGDFEKTFENGAKLTAYLLKTYHLSIHDVKQHADFMDKNCPETIRNTGRWQEFLDLVLKYVQKVT